MTAGGSDEKNTVASSRLRNSGVNTRSSAFLPSLLSPTVSPKPIRPAASSREPALLVMMRMVLRKSALRPLLSVSVALSITCRRML